MARVKGDTMVWAVEDSHTKETEISGKIRTVSSFIVLRTMEVI